MNLNLRIYGATITTLPRSSLFKVARAMGMLQSCKVDSLRQRMAIQMRRWRDYHGFVDDVTSGSDVIGND